MRRKRKAAGAPPPPFSLLPIPIPIFFAILNPFFSSSFFSSSSFFFSFFFFFCRCFHLVSAEKGICHKQCTEVEVVNMLHMLGSGRLFPFLAPTAPTRTSDRCLLPPSFILLAALFAAPLLFFCFLIWHIIRQSALCTYDHSPWYCDHQFCTNAAAHVHHSRGLHVLLLWHGSDNLHCLVQGHLKITGSAQLGIPGGLESGPQRPSSWYGPAIGRSSMMLVPFLRAQQ